MARIQESDTSPLISIQCTTCLFVGDLDHCFNDSQLYDHFSKFGEVVSVRVCRDLTSQQSLGYGHVKFANSHDAEKAMNSVCLTPLNRKPIRIMRISNAAFEMKANLDPKNLYLKNLDTSVDEEMRRDRFSVFGTVTSCKIMRKPPRKDGSRGISKGYGFIMFSTPEEAARALGEMIGKMICNKPLHVEHAQKKETRAGGLELLISKGSAPMPNFYRGAGPTQQLQDPLPLMQQQENMLEGSSRRPLAAVIPSAKYYQCIYCYKEFWTPKNVTDHTLSIHKGYNRVFCQVCGNGFMYENGYTQHISECTL